MGSHISGQADFADMRFITCFALQAVAVIRVGKHRSPLLESLRNLVNLACHPSVGFAFTYSTFDDLGIAIVRTQRYYFIYANSFLPLGCIVPQLAFPLRETVLYNTQHERLVIFFSSEFAHANFIRNG